MFNVADSAITVGVILIMAVLLFSKEEKKEPVPSTEYRLPGGESVKRET